MIFIKPSYWAVSNAKGGNMERSGRRIARENSVGVVVRSVGEEWSAKGWELTRQSSKVVVRGKTSDGRGCLRSQKTKQ